MTTLAAVKRIAKRIGATLEIDGDCFYLTAPPGHIFVGSETHGGDYGPESAGFIFRTKREAYEAALADMNHGVQECGCRECRSAKEGSR